MTEAARRAAEEYMTAHPGEWFSREQVIGMLAQFASVTGTAAIAQGMREERGRVTELRELLKEAWHFPDFPSPGEGMVSDADDALEQEEWRKRYGILSEKITVALAADEEGKG